MRSPRPSIARRTRPAVVSSDHCGWYPPGTNRVTIDPRAQIPSEVFTSGRSIPRDVEGRERNEIGIGMLGYAFMGKAHSNAFLKIAYMTWPPPLHPRLVAVLLVQLLRIVELVAVDQVAETVDRTAHALGRRLARPLRLVPAGDEPRHHRPEGPDPE